MSDSKPFLDFYKKHNISPVSQDISDLSAHLGRRAALYRLLGIPPGLVKGTSALEFGPGSGHNALYTKYLEPSRYVLVDANPTGLENVRNLLGAGTPEGECVTVVDSLIEEFDTDERFDLVLCEGVIPWQKDPAAILRTVSRFAAKGGLVVMTCIDAVSSVSENLRRLMARVVSDPADPVEKRVQTLLPVFAPHLNTLKGMTRPHEDWILDQILQPFIGKLFSMREAIETLDGQFSVHGASPNFLTDWTWYKEVPTRPESDNEVALHQFDENLHNFIDYSRLHAPRDAGDNRRLHQLCDEVFDHILDLENTTGVPDLEQAIRLCDRLADEVSKFSSETGLAFGEFAQGLRTAAETGTFPEMPLFAGLWGRGQQYLSFIREGA